MTAVHHGDPGIAFGKQGINKGHGRGAGTDHQIICVDFIHAIVPKIISVIWPR